MEKRKFTVSDDYGTLATFWSEQVARATILRWTGEGRKGLRLHDNETGDLLVVVHPDKLAA